MVRASSPTLVPMTGKPEIGAARSTEIKMAEELP
jgi:hypothetical protein